MREVLVVRILAEVQSEVHIKFDPQNNTEIMFSFNNTVMLVTTHTGMHNLLTFQKYGRTAQF